MPPKLPKPNTVTVHDAATALGLSKQRVHQLVDEGKLQVIAWPRHVLVLRTSLDALLTGRRAAQ
jgi:excisionase family DNA binding protein